MLWGKVAPGIMHGLKTYPWKAPGDGVLLLWLITEVIGTLKMNALENVLLMQHFEQVLSCYKQNRVKILHLKLQAIKGKYMLCKEYNFLHSSMKETLQGKLVHEIIQCLLHPIYG